MSSVFVGQAVVGKHLSDESGADVDTQLGQHVSNPIHIVIGLEARADDECLDLLGAFRWCVGTRPFGQEVGRGPLKDGVANVVVGFPRLEAKAGGELAFGEAAEFPECDQADLLLDGLFLGEGDGLSGTVSEHERAVFDLNVDIESNMHGHPLPQGGVGTSRALRICIRNLCTRSRAKHWGEWADQLSGFNVYKCRYGRELMSGGRHWTVSAIIQYTSCKIHIRLDRGAMEPRGVMVTIRGGGELLLLYPVKHLPIRSINFYYREFPATRREKHSTPAVAGCPLVTLTRVSADAGFPCHLH